jgi:hypothetical protein
LNSAVWLQIMVAPAFLSSRSERSVQRLSNWFGPIFGRGIEETSRSGRSYVARVVYGLLLLAGLAIAWRQQSERTHGYFHSLREMAVMAEALFQTVTALQYGAVVLFVPLFLCSVVAGEREALTLDAVFFTYLSDREIVLGKLWSRLIGLVLLIVSSLPVLSMLPLFGGIEPEALGRMFTATMLMLVFASSHGVYFSVISPSSSAALVRTYAFLALWLLGMPAVFLIPRGAFDPLISVLTLINPAGPFLAAYDGFFYARMKANLGVWFFPLSFIVPFAWSSLVVLSAVRRLHRQPVLFTAVVARIGWLRPLRERLRFEIEIERLRLKQEGWRRRRVTNPLWLRARRTRVYDPDGYIGRLQWTAWLVAFGFLYFLMFTDRRADWNGEFAALFLAPLWLAVLIVAAILASASFVLERRRGSLDPVLMSPLSGREIIDGVGLAVWEQLQRLYWLPVLLGLLMTMSGSPQLPAFLASAVTATLFICVVVLQGVACSLTSRNLVRALLPASALPVVTIVGLPVASALLQQEFAPVCWAVAAMFLLFTHFWVSRTVTPASIGSHLLAIHLICISVGTYWTCGNLYGQPTSKYPALAMSPAEFVVNPLVSPDAWFPDDQDLLVCLSYWAALIANLFWARWWLIRHFDAFSERIGIEPRKPLPHLMTTEKGFA